MAVFFKSNMMEHVLYHIRLEKDNHLIEYEKDGIERKLSRKIANYAQKELRPWLLKKNKKYRTT